jgi:hypothetical protein
MKNRANQLRPKPKISRKVFLRSLLYGLPVATAANAFWLEPGWLKTKSVRLTDGTPSHRLVHFTDLHHKGDREFTENVVQKINALSPDFVCFTGDIIEDEEHLDEALEILKDIKAPLFGVPGNHDYWAHADFDVIAAAFESTGGRWLMDEQATTANGTIQISGFTCQKPPPVRPVPEKKNIALIHYPLWVEKLPPLEYDLVLAGHSHGGQVRLPFIGALVLPFNVGKYDLGLFKTAAGPLYVNAGIGWFYLNMRFNCRPEITVFEI